MRISDWSSDVCSSDLQRTRIQKQLCQTDPTGVLGCLNTRRDSAPFNGNATFTAALTSKEFLATQGIPAAFALRSEEHTSELQSLMRISYAVFCLKKKNKSHIIQHNNTHIQHKH